MRRYDTDVNIAIGILAGSKGLPRDVAAEKAVQVMKDHGVPADPERVERVLNMTVSELLQASR